jgi:hypothetical protein
MGWVGLEKKEELKLQKYFCKIPYQTSLEMLLSFVISKS